MKGAVLVVKKGTVQYFCPFVLFKGTGRMISTIILHIGTDLHLHNAVVSVTCTLIILDFCL